MEKVLMIPLAIKRKTSDTESEIAGTLTVSITLV